MQNLFRFHLCNDEELPVGDQERGGWHYGGFAIRLFAFYPGDPDNWPDQLKRRPGYQIISGIFLLLPSPAGCQPYWLFIYSDLKYTGVYTKT